MYSAGGRFDHPPARLTIPQDGRWYLVADLRGYSTQAEVTVQVLRPGDSETPATEAEVLVSGG